LAEALRSWLEKQPRAINVLIAGGGNPVDAIREASRAGSLDDESAHWAAIDAMSINARLLAGLLDEAEFISTFTTLKAAITDYSYRQTVFDVRQFLRGHESKLDGCILPHDWSVTSDSIAARLAEVLAADELVLLKSADPPCETTTALANAGFVDRNFPVFDGCSFRRRFVNLRQSGKCPVAFEN
jgi:aspartokinase-like uncharacterized kinase